MDCAEQIGVGSFHWKSDRIGPNWAYPIQFSNHCFILCTNLGVAFKEDSLGKKLLDMLCVWFLVKNTSVI